MGWSTAGLGATAPGMSPKSPWATAGSVIGTVAPGPQASASARPHMPVAAMPQAPVDNTPAQTAKPQSSWTGVSSNMDPYGVGGIGYDLPSGVSRKDLLSLNSPQTGNTADSTGANPYVNQSDPYSAQAGQDSAWAAQQATVSQQNTGNMQAQMSAQSYPSYPNSYNLGGGLGGAGPTSPGSNYSGGGVTVNVPDTSSRGFNPWSMVGESNARDTSQGVVSPNGPQQNTVM